MMAGKKSPLLLILCLGWTRQRLYQYDLNGEMFWLDEFEALSEQAPEGARFAVLQGDETAFTDILDTGNIKENGYIGDSDIVSLLDNCLNIFDDSSANRNKVVIATASKVPDARALDDKINELRGYGVIPFVFVLNSNTDEALGNIENVYQCVNDSELRVNISDLYLSFTEFHNGQSATLNTSYIKFAERL